MNMVWDVLYFPQHKDICDLHFTHTLAAERKQMSALTKWNRGEGGNSEPQFEYFGANSKPSTGKYWEWGKKWDPSEEVSFLTPGS